MADIRLASLTIFTTPVVNTLLRALSRLYLKAAGWQLSGELPPDRRYVMIAAPHTSNWDLPMTLAVAFALRLKLYFFAKHTLFTPPFGWFLRWLGGIPVDRRRANSLVEQAVDLFAVREELVLVVPPEGTRQRVRYWKSGFYHIAHGAGVPIALGFIDFRRRIAGIGGMFVPTGDYDADLGEIQAFYTDITGRNPALTSELAAGTTDIMKP